MAALVKRRLTMTWIFKLDNNKFGAVVVPLSMGSGTTKIVNIKEDPSYDVYIGRYMRVNKRNVLSNGYEIGIDGPREEVIRKYAYDFPIRWRTEPDFKQAVLRCRGKRLGCFCKPEVCHGDVIVDFLNGYKISEKEGFSALKRYDR